MGYLWVWGGGPGNDDRWLLEQGGAWHTCSMLSTVVSTLQLCPFVFRGRGVASSLFFFCACPEEEERVETGTLIALQVFGFSRHLARYFFKYPSCDKCRHRLPTNFHGEKFMVESEVKTSAPTRHMTTNATPPAGRPWVARFLWPFHIKMTGIFFRRGFSNH